MTWRVGRFGQNLLVVDYTDLVRGTAADNVLPTTEQCMLLLLDVYVDVDAILPGPTRWTLHP